MRPFFRAGLVIAGMLAAVACSSNNDDGDDGDDGGNVAFSYSPCTGSSYWPTVLVAVQDGAGAWTAITPSGGTYATTIHSAKGGLLVVSASGTDHDLQLLYGTASELKTYGTAPSCVQLGSFNGSVNNLAAGEAAYVGMGWNSTYVSGPGNKTYSTQARGATGDLLAILSNASSPGVKGVLRRGISSGAVSAIDFTTGEAFALTSPALTITGTGSEAVTLAEWYYSSPTQRNQVFYGNSSTTLPTSYVGIPAAQQQSGDLHELYAFTPSVISNNVTTSRTVIGHYHDASARTLAFEAMPTAPVVSVAATAPYPRLKAQFAFPSGHDVYQLYWYNNNGQSVDFYVTNGYLGSATEVTFPDLTALAGFSTSWMPSAGVAATWGFLDYAYSGNQGTFDYALSDGQVTRYFSWRSTITP